LAADRVEEAADVWVVAEDEGLRLAQAQILHVLQRFSPPGEKPWPASRPGNGATAGCWCCLPEPPTCQSEPGNIDFSSLSSLRMTSIRLILENYYNMSR